MPIPVLRQTFEVISIVRDGGQASIQKWRNMETEEVVAAKVYHDRSQAAMRNFDGEAAIACSMNYRFIVKTHGVILPASQNDNAALVMDFVSGGTLDDAIRARRLNDTQKAKIVIELLRALNYLDELGIAHCDLKPSNVLLTDDLHVKLADFGSAMPPSGDTITTTLHITPAYAAPELQRGEVHKSVDIFSFGLILYELATGRRVFDGTQAADDLQAEKLQGQRPSMEGVLPSLRQILTRCWNATPAERPTQQELSHAFGALNWRLFPGVDQSEITRFITALGPIEDHAGQREQLLHLRALEEELEATREQRARQDAAQRRAITELREAAADRERRRREDTEGLTARLGELQVQNAGLRAQTLQTQERSMVVEGQVRGLRGENKKVKEELEELKGLSVAPWRDSLEAGSILRDKVEAVIKNGGVTFPNKPTLVAKVKGKFELRKVVNEMEGKVPLLLLVQLANGRVVGGLAKVPWPAHWSADDPQRASFIFSLEEPFARYAPEVKDHAVSTGRSFFCFGGACGGLWLDRAEVGDLSICVDGTFRTCAKPGVYKVPEGGGAARRRQLQGSDAEQVKYERWELWHVV
jgi:predicted Ser/Thr protein kinase